MTVEGEKRDQWGSKLDFILSCLGYAVGLGNVWRFPYLCGSSGGAAFLIPYFIFMIFAGFPVFYLELAIGQYAALTPHMLYRRMCPIFTGIGYAMVMISLFTGIYYNMVIAWSLYYFGVSFTSRLPWSDCLQQPMLGVEDGFNNNLCWDNKIATSCDNVTEVYYLGRCFNSTGELPLSSKNLDLDVMNSTNEILAHWERVKLNDDKTKNVTIKETPAKQYLDRRVLKIHEGDGLNWVGYPSWELVLCLLFAWILVFLCLIKGIKSSGKVVYFTATFPYLILVILMIRGLLLDGAIDGIKYYVIPEWKYLAEPKTWGAAAIQIFFSLSLGGGGLTTLASYNEFNNNLLRDTLIVVIGNCATSLFAGFVIFPIIGFIAKKTGSAVADIAAGGTTLAFTVYPDALVEIAGAPFWAVLFFFMLILLGIDSQLVIVEVVITCIIDQWPSLRVFKKKVCVVAGVCIICFIIGICLTTPGGSDILGLLDKYAGGWTLVIACLAEVCMVSYCYGWKRFLKDIRLMMGRPPNACWRGLGYPVNPYWWINWIIITPLLLVVVLIFNFIGYEATSPAWAGVLGWLITLFVVMWIPLFAIIYTIQAVRNKKGFKWLITPTQDWGPNSEAAKQTIAREYPMQPGVVDSKPVAPGYAYDNKGYIIGQYPASAAPYAQQPYSGNVMKS